MATTTRRGWLTRRFQGRRAPRRAATARPRLEWLEGRLAPAVVLGYGGPGTDLTLTDSPGVGSHPTITLSDPGTNQLTIALAGATFDPTSATTGVTYNGASPDTSTSATIDISTAGDVTALKATLSESVVLDRIADAAGGLGDLSISTGYAGSVSVTGVVDLTHAPSGKGNVNLNAAGMLVLPAGALVAPTASGTVTLTSGDLTIDGTLDGSAVILPQGGLIDFRGGAVVLPHGLNATGGTLTMFDFWNTSARTWVVTGDSVLRPGTAPITYSGLSALSITAGEADTILVQGTSAGMTSVGTAQPAGIAGAGVCVISSPAGTLDTLKGDVNASGFAVLDISEANATAGDTVTFARGRVYPFFSNTVSFAGVGRTIQYSFLGSLLGVITGSGSDHVIVSATGAPQTVIATGAGDDSVAVPLTYDMFNPTLLAGGLYVDEGAGANSLAVSEAGRWAGNVLGVSVGAIWGAVSLPSFGHSITPLPAGSPWGLSYVATGGTFADGISVTTDQAVANTVVVTGAPAGAPLTINGGAGNDLFYVYGAPAGAALTINTGAGNDGVAVEAAPPGASVVVNNGGGSDQFLAVFTPSSGYHLTLNGGGADVLSVIDAALTSLVWDVPAGAGSGWLNVLYPPPGLTGAVVYSGVGRVLSNRPIHT